MKKNLLIPVLISLSLFAGAQANQIAQADIRDGYHIFNYTVNSVRQCDENGNLTPTSKNLNKNWQFSVYFIKGNSYIIHILRFKDKVTNYQGLNQEYVTDAAGKDIFFELSKDDYDKNAERLYKKGYFTVGAATNLIKVRPGKKDPKDGYKIYSEIGNDFNIGVTAGWKFKPYRKTDLAVSFMGGFAFSSITATPYTTKNFVTAESSQSCLTVSGGIVFEYKLFQVSAFTGIDIMSGEIGQNWIYKGRNWVGIGLGYQIFRAEGESAQK